MSFVFTAFHFGYAIGCNPIVGYHYGAGNEAELKSVLRKSLFLTGTVGLGMTAAAELLAGPISFVYVGYDPGLCQMTIQGMKLFGLSFLISGFNIFASAFFTGLNNGMVSAMISMLRTLVFQVAAVLLLPIWLKLDGIWLSVVAAEAATLVITLGFFVANRKKYHYF